MFYCRENELSTMNHRFTKGNFECIVIYGRRRVGKTALINEFCKDKPTIYFSALNASLQENLEALSDAIYHWKNPDAAQAPIYASISAALDEIVNYAKNERMIFVIDEYPYLAKSDPSISSRLQHLIDHKLQNSKLYLILCGSSMSFMEHQVLGYESPLYGRRTAQLKIQPLNYYETAQFNPDLTAEQQALVYGITGGIPHYINKLEVTSDLDNALLENVFNSSSYLFEEPENLLKQELREPALYNSIITAIAGGASRANEISTKVGIESSVCNKYLKVLLDLGIVMKETPITEKAGKKTIYNIEDNFFKFWYRFVPSNMSMINAGRIGQIYERAIKKYFPDYMGLIFEKMCKEYLLNYAELPFLMSSVGRWWGTDSKSHKQVEIDIVGTPVEGNEYLIGSCKYRNEKIGTDELELIKSYATVFGKGEKYDYYIFSKGGFTDSLIEQAKSEGVTLLTLDDIYQING